MVKGLGPCIVHDRGLLHKRKEYVKATLLHSPPNLNITKMYHV